MAVAASLPRTLPASSPYAVFRASDWAWTPARGPSAPMPPPAVAIPPSRPRKRSAARGVIQGELFAFQPNVLPFQPHSRAGASSKPM
jgi:hypothetical protein